MFLFKQTYQSSPTYLRTVIQGLVGWWRDYWSDCSVIVHQGNYCYRMKTEINGDYINILYYIMVNIFNEQLVISKHVIYISISFVVIYI